MDKISHKKLNTTLTRKGNTHSKVKKGLKRTITKLVRAKLKRQLKLEI
jgi:hypothetical protein